MYESAFFAATKPKRKIWKDCLYYEYSKIERKKGEGGVIQSMFKSLLVFWEIFGTPQGKYERSACTLFTLYLVIESTQHHSFYTHYTQVGKDNRTRRQVHKDYNRKEKLHHGRLYIYKPIGGKEKSIIGSE